MIPPWIIEQIRKREEDSQREDERPALRLPLEEPYPPMMPDRRNDEEEERGVVIIDLCSPDGR